MNLVELYMEDPKDTEMFFKEEVDDYQHQFNTSRRRAFKEIQEIYEVFAPPYSAETVLTDRGY